MKNIIIVILALALMVIGVVFIVNNVNASEAPCACAVVNTNTNTETSITTIVPEPEVIEVETPIDTKEMLHEQECALAIMEQLFTSEISYSETAFEMNNIQEDMEEQYADIIEEEAHISKDPYRPGDVCEYFTEAEWRILRVYSLVSTLAQKLENSCSFAVLEEYAGILSCI